MQISLESMFTLAAFSVIVLSYIHEINIQSHKKSTEDIGSTLSALMNSMSNNICCSCLVWECLNTI